MSGLLGGGGGGIDDRIANIVVKVFDEYDIEPGELNENINDAVQLVQEFKPILEGVEDISKDMDNDVTELREDINRFNENIEEFNEMSSELSEAFTRTADSFERFNGLVEEAAEAKEGKQE